MKGWITLDIDGTITTELRSIPAPVISHLTQLNQEGWNIAFITGRALCYTDMPLKGISFPYFLAVQNGADILEMPSKRLISRSYLDHKVIGAIDQAYVNEKEDFILYSGYEKGDFCYYRPSRYSSKLLSYLKKLGALSVEPWRPLDSFDFGHEDYFPMVKCLGPQEEMKKIHSTLAQIENVDVTLIRDPFSDDGFYLNLVTSQKATKGKAVQKLRDFSGGGLIIAAGDDLNDTSMIEAADIGIVMQTAPQSLLDKAHIIAPPAAQMGIIQGLKKACAGL